MTEHTCTYCGTTFEAPATGQVRFEVTRDMPPPAHAAAVWFPTGMFREDRTINWDGTRVIHECRRGTPVERSEP